MSEPRLHLVLAPQVVQGGLGYVHPPETHKTSHTANFKSHWHQFCTLFLFTTKSELLSPNPKSLTRGQSQLWHRVKVDSGMGLPMVNMLKTTLEWTYGELQSTLAQISQFFGYRYFLFQWVADSDVPAVHRGTGTLTKLKRAIHSHSKVFHLLVSVQDRWYIGTDPDLTPYLTNDEPFLRQCRTTVQKSVYRVCHTSQIKDQLKFATAFTTYRQCFGSGLNPDSIRSLDLNSESG